MTYCPVWDYYTPAPGSPALIVMCSNQQAGHRAHYAELTMYGRAGSIHYITKTYSTKEVQHG